ncbi:uncharacterized protein LOC144168983 [Haemaphysalis longicornis]
MPVPDKHLVNLWNTREQLCIQYLNNGRLFKDLLRVRKKAAEARRYAKRLARSRWLDHCASFSEKTGSTKLWHTFRTLIGKAKAAHTGRNICLATSLSAAEFEEEAARTFFPQPSIPPAPTTYQWQPPENDVAQNAPFTPQEMAIALGAINVRSAPGKDGITWRMLQNLDEDAKMQLLSELNAVWMSGELPVDWKHSVVYPIPKAGKKMNNINNMRPISLTSTLCKLLERMVLTRLSYILENAGAEPYYDEGQTGFRPGLCTYDSLLLLRNLTGKKRRRTKIPAVIVAVDLKKAFDTVRHSAIIEALQDCGAGTRVINFVKSFLNGRTFEIRTELNHPRVFTNTTGVPQGAILSPTLFNLVMRKIAKQLRNIPHLQHTMYADDITIWVDPRCTTLNTQQVIDTIQLGLDTIDRCLPPTGMSPSPEKTKYLVIGGLDHLQAQIHFTLNGQPIERAADRWLRILGVPLHEDGGASEWIRQIICVWKQQLHIIKRIGGRFGGATTQVLRTLTQAVLTSKACYGAPCFALTKTQYDRLETLHRESLRVITGLPRHTRVEELYRYSQLPPLRAIITERVEGHNRRRAATRAGQLVQKLASGQSDSLFPQLPAVRAPWEDVLVRVSKPLSRLRGRNHNHHERAAIAARADRRAGAIFTTAVLNETTSRASLSCIDGQMRISRTIQFLHPPSPCQTRLAAVLLAAEHIEATYGAGDNHHFTIFTDSPQALDRLGKTPYVGTTCDLIKTICRRLRDTRNIVVRVDCVPGHAGGIGSETAYACASEHFELRSNPALPVPFAQHDPDPPEAKAAARHASKQSLRNLVPPDPAPLPAGLPRGAQVLLHKARAGAALTDDVLAKWRAYVPKRHHRAVEVAQSVATVACTSCSTGATPTVHHMLWDCPGLQTLRLQYLPPGVQRLVEWTTPLQPATARQTLLSLWEFARSSGVDRRM